MSPAAPANHKGGVWLQALADIVKTSDGGFISGDRLGMQLALVPGCPSLKLIAKAHGGYLSMNKVLSRLLGHAYIVRDQEEHRVDATTLGEYFASTYDILRWRDIVDWVGGYDALDACLRPRGLRVSRRAGSHPQIVAIVKKERDQELVDASANDGVWLQALADIVKTSDGGFISGDRLGMQLALVPECPSLKLIAKAHGGYLSMNKVIRSLGVCIFCAAGKHPEFVFFSSVLEWIAHVVGGQEELSVDSQTLGESFASKYDIVRLRDIIDLAGGYDAFDALLRPHSLIVFRRGRSQPQYAHVHYVLGQTLADIGRLVRAARRNSMNERKLGEILTTLPTLSLEEVLSLCGGYGANLDQRLAKHGVVIVETVRGQKLFSTVVERMGINEHRCPSPLAASSFNPPVAIGIDTGRRQSGPASASTLLAVPSIPAGAQPDYSVLEIEGDTIPPSTSNAEEPLGRIPAEQNASTPNSLACTSPRLRECARQLLLSSVCPADYYNWSLSFRLRLHICIVIMSQFYCVLNEVEEVLAIADGSKLFEKFDENHYRDDEHLAAKWLIDTVSLPNYISQMETHD